MILTVIQNLLHGNLLESAMDAEYESCRDLLGRAGLCEQALRNMDPDDRVALLERACLDPYDYIYLAC